MLCGALLATLGAAAQNPLNQPAAASPYGGSVVEDIVARVNDQIITQSDYDRAVQQLNEEGQQHGESMQDMSEARRDLLRNLIDQQLWLSKGKELGITGDTELIKRLDEIRKQYNMASLEDLENAAKQQGVSWEDFQQNIRNQIITQDVMRQEVGEKIQFTPGEAMQYYDQHKQDFEQPESVRLSEILIPASSDDAAKLAAARTKADDIEAKLKTGTDFAELARTESQGQTAAQGGDLGQYRRGALAKVLEDKTFPLQAGQWTDPIQTRQGWVILKVTQHTPAGAQPYKDVQDQVEEALYMSRMEPAIREYLTKMREEAFIDIKPGYVDTGASPNETKPVFSAYVPPAPKKKAKVERARYREETHGFRQKSAVVSDAAPASQATTAQAAGAKDKNKKDAAEKPGKKEKIRYGQAPRETLPTAAAAGSNTENAGALPESAAANEPANPLEPTAPTTKTRFSARARTEQKHKKNAAAQNNSQTPSAPNAAEVADRQTQAAPLGLSGDTASKKKKKKAQTTTGEKTRMSQEQKKPSESKPAPEMTPAPQEPGAPAPADHPASQPTPQSQQ
jgi:peptidyl-prolyl cis-trans isomerase SurA